MTDTRGKTCPKCSYVRKASDTVPDWKCPACGVVYDKFGVVPKAAEPVSDQGSFGNRLIYAALGAISGAVLGVAGWFLYGMEFSHSVNQPGRGNTNLLYWVYTSAGMFAVYGFLYKDKVADVAAADAEVMVEREVNSYFPRFSWLGAFIVVVLVAGFVWYNFKH